MDDKPLFVFIHWGSEYTDCPNLRERQLSEWLREQGVELVIGAHSHRASNLRCDLEFCEIFSLGNFIFDQPWDYTSGKLLEINFFPQKTYFSKTHEIPNFFTEL